MITSSRTPALCENTEIDWSWKSDSFSKYMSINTLSSTKTLHSPSSPFGLHIS
jgi:hypothetical protein